MAESDKIIRGIHLVESGEFYYIETITSRYNIDSLIAILMQRRKIKESKTNKTEFNVITLYEAKLEKLTIIPIFQSEHAKKVWEEQQNKKPGNIW